MRRPKIRWPDITTTAALLVTLATALASLSWISAGRAGGQAGDLKTAALGFMILRLEAATEASNELLQAQSYLTQAGMYYAQADAAEDVDLQGQLAGLGDQSIEMSDYHAAAAKDSNVSADKYYTSYEYALDRSAVIGGKSDNRSTAALIFNVSAAAASLVVIFKRRWLLGVCVPVFLVGMSYFAISFL